MARPAVLPLLCGRFFPIRPVSPSIHGGAHVSGKMLEATAVVLAWQGPFSFRADAPRSVFTGPTSSASGIYLWVVPAATSVLIHGLGETGRPFWERHHEHLRAFESGKYPIYRAGSLAAGRRDPIHPGYSGDKSQRDRVRARFGSKRDRMLMELAANLSLIEIYLAPLSAGLRIRQRIRTGLLKQIRIRVGQKSLCLAGPVGKHPRLPTEAALKVASVGQGRVGWLEGEFEA